MPQLTIRTALASEQAALEALQWRASLNNPGDRDALLAHPDAIELPLDQIEGGGVFVAEEQGGIQGFAAIVRREDSDVELDALFVEPASWRRGIGRALLEHCVSKAGVMGATSLHVLGNPHAERFYRACGFTHVGTQQTRFGLGLLFSRRVFEPSAHTLPKEA
jgi:GNAT superfamily N-acetyltransferase